MKTLVAILPVILSSCGSTKAAPPPKEEPSALGTPDKTLLPTPSASAAASAAPKASEPPPKDDSEIVTLAKGQHAASALTTDDNHVYWVDESEGSLNRIGKRGGITAELNEGNGVDAPGSTSIAVEGSEVFWTEFVKPEGAQKGFGHVWRQDKGGGKATAVEKKSPDPLRGLFVNKTHIYWVGGSSVFRAARDGGAPAVIARGQKDPSSVFADTQFVYFAVRGSGEAGKKDGAIQRLSGRGLVTLVAGEERPNHVFSDDNFVYWTALTDIKKAPKGSPSDKPEKPCGGTCAAELVGKSDTAITDVTADATHIYFTTFSSGDDGAVKRIAKTGGAVETLAKGQNRPVGIAVDQDNLYWACRGTEAKAFKDGTIMKRAKP